MIVMPRTGNTNGCNVFWTVCVGVIIFILLMMGLHATEQVPLLAYHGSLHKAAMVSSRLSYIPSIPIFIPVDFDRIYRSISVIRMLSGD